MKKFNDDISTKSSERQRVVHTKRNHGEVSGKLLKIAREHAIKYGISSISVRAICMEADDVPIPKR
jgi:hypothetical protein